MNRPIIRAALFTPRVPHISLAPSEGERVGVRGKPGRAFAKAPSSILATLAFLFSLFIITLQAATHPPLALHPDNPHYFLFRGKPAVLISSGEHYGAVLNRDFDYIPYLNELRAKKLNHTRLFSGTYREVPASFGITENTLAPQPESFLSPWARSQTPGEHYGGNKFDLTRWDEAFFQRLKHFIAEAGKRGIVVEINLFCPLYEEALWQVSPMNTRNNVNGFGEANRKDVLTLKHADLVAAQKAVTRKFVRELNGFDNIYYEVCNEPWVGGVTTEWQDVIIATIQEAQASLPRKHLISLNLLGLNIKNPNPAVSIFNYHHADAAEPVARNYALNKAIGDNETGFRGQDNLPYRTEAWDCILAGGALFSALDYSFSVSHPGGTLTGYKSPGGGNAAYRKELCVLKEFIHEFDFVRMKPAPEVVREMSPSGLATTQVLAESGKAYAIYARRRTEVDQFTVRWTGTVRAPADGKFTFYTMSNDDVRLWVNDQLVIENVKHHALMENSGEIALSGSKPVKLRLEYYEAATNSVAKLSWSGPQLEKAVISSAHLKAEKGEPGLTGEYFEDRRMKQRILSRNEPAVDFAWQGGGPFPVSAQALPVTMHLDLHAGNYRAQWMEPKSGRSLGRERFRHAGGAKLLESPAFSEDIALRITAR